MKLRDYQDDCVDALFAYWESGGQNPIIALPTGTGKSLVIAEFVRRALLKYPGTNIVILAHVKELIEQNFKTLIQHWPTAPAGIFSSAGICMPGMLGAFDLSVSPDGIFIPPISCCVPPMPPEAMPMSAIVRSGRVRRGGIGPRMPARGASEPTAYPLRSMVSAKTV